MINRSLTPYVLRNISKTQLPAVWESNNAAWMTPNIFKDRFYNCFIGAVNLYNEKIILYFKVFVGYAKFRRGLRNCLAS